ELPRAFSAIHRRLTSRVHPKRWRNATIGAPCSCGVSKEAFDFIGGPDPLDLRQKARKVLLKSRRGETHNPEFVHIWIHSSNFDLEGDLRDTVIDQLPRQDSLQDGRSVAMLPQTDVLVGFVF
ncbi:hypothetical protein GCK32_012733, partial [Trichostrongylus colubriformis]